MPDLGSALWADCVEVPCIAEELPATPVTDVVPAPSDNPCHESPAGSQYT